MVMTLYMTNYRDNTIFCTILPFSIEGLLLLPRGCVNMIYDWPV